MDSTYRVAVASLCFTEQENTKYHLKFGDGDGPNLCTVKKADVSSTFIENIFGAG